MWHRIWQVFIGRKSPADPRVSEIRPPVKSEFHTVVTKSGLGVTFSQRKALTSLSPTMPSLSAPRPCLVMGVQHARRNTEGYNSDEVEAMARQVASEHASIHFCHFIDWDRAGSAQLTNRRQSA